MRFPEVWRKDWWIARVLLKELEKMDWFKQNKIAVGVALASIVASIQTSGLFPDPRAVLGLNILGTLAGMVTGAGMNVKSDKQQKVESVIGEVPKRRLID